MKKRNWICVEVPCSEDAADDLAAEIADEFEVGVEITDRGVRFYLEEDRLSGEQESKLKRILDRFKSSLHPGFSGSCSTSPLLDDDWADNWKAYFKPLRVGRRFLICPTWETVDPEPRDRIIRMDPGRAFGTGQHETTRLCLEWLEDRSLELQDPGSRSLLDLGAGSGILAIGAALLGFGRVLGMDNDPEPLEVAAENTALNRFSHVINLQEGTACDIEDLFDIVVANIMALPLIEMASVLVRRLKDSGRMGLSGILIEQMESVRAAYEAAGLELFDTRTAGEWCLLDFRWKEREGRG
jgi:ribosomal protein L11 methyltransferase